MENFTPVTALIGGGLIGLAATLLMVANGRVAGISGVLSGAALGGDGERLWRVLFVLGLLAAPALYTALSGAAPAFQLDASAPMIALGGLLVGFGTRLGSGCTSGHGVCGMARLSPRSAVSVAIFMSVAIVTLALTNMIGG